MNEEGAVRHIISILVEDKFGVLARVSGLFSGRGYNIESLTVNVTERPDVSMMTIVTRGDEHVIEQIIKQLRKLVNVLKVRDLTSFNHIERELVLIKVFVSQKNRGDLYNIVGTFRAKVVDLTPESMVIEITGSEDKLQAFVELVRPYGIIELVRTGRLAIGRGARATSDMEKPKNSLN